MKVAKRSLNFKKMRVLFILFFPLLIFSQNHKRGSVVYEYKMHKVFLEEIKELSSKLEEDSKNITFTLEFDQNLTLFYLNESLSTSKNLAISFTKARKPIISDLVKKKYYQYTPYSVLFLENEFTIEYEYINWKLIDESKIIDGNIVFKAEGEIKVLVNNEIINQKIVAWYCPEIPINIGPRGANGLPGLIFILEDRYGAFIVKNINLNLKPMIDRKILENKIISEKSFFDLLIERRKIFDEAVENKK